MEVVTAFLVAILVEAIKLLRARYSFATSAIWTVLILLAVSFAAAVAYTVMVKTGIWPKFYEILLIAAGIHNLLLRYISPATDEKKTE